MRTKSEILRLVILRSTLFLALCIAPQAFAESKAEVGFCSISFNVYFLKSSNKTIADKPDFVHPICFTASEHDHVTALSKLGMFVSSKLSRKLPH